MIDKRKYPLFLLKIVQNLYKEIRIIVDENNGLLEVVKNEEFEIEIKDSAKDSNFRFSVSEPQATNSKAIFTVEFNPVNSERLDSHNTKTSQEYVIVFLKDWIKLIREYNSINLSPEERILNEYENEFYEDFEIIDEDADIKPYGLETQIQIHNFLLHTIDILEKDKEENQLLIDEATKLKKDLTTLTKKSTVRRLSKLFAKVRQKSLALPKEVLGEAKKEFIKKGIGNGFEYVSNLIEAIN